MSKSLTSAYDNLVRTIDGGNPQPDDVADDIVSFVRELRSVPGCEAELKRRATFVETNIRDGSTFHEAMDAALSYCGEHAVQLGVAAASPGVLASIGASLGDADFLRAIDPTDYPEDWLLKLSEEWLAVGDPSERYYLLGMLDELRKKLEVARRTVFRPAEAKEGDAASVLWELLGVWHDQIVEIQDKADPLTDGCYLLWHVFVGRKTAERTRSHASRARGLIAMGPSQKEVKDAAGMMVELAENVTDQGSATLAAAEEAKPVGAENDGEVDVDDEQRTNGDGDGDSSEDSQVRAHQNKLFSPDFPDDADLRDLAVRIDQAHGTDQGPTAIAREFTGEEQGSDKKAQRLLARLRKQKQEEHYFPKERT